MSYESMWREADECNFPACNDQFDHAEGAWCAIIDKNGKTNAFCKKHSTQLIQEGIVLRPLAEIHAEQREAKEAPIRERQKREQIAREKAFIAQLKNK